MALVAVGLLAWLAALMVSSGGVDTAFEGCFERSYVEEYSWYYKINHPIVSMEAGLAACNNRLTTHMGLREDDRSPGTFHIYCGNNLPELSSKVQSCWYSSPQNTSSHECGGPNSMCVFRLRDITPLAALLATDQGVEMLVGNQTTLKVSYANASPYKLVDYLYNEDAIFFTNDEELIRYDFDYRLMQYNYTQLVVKKDSLLRSLAVDFTKHELYWGYWAEDYIYKTVLDTNHTTLLSDRTGYPFHFCLEPYNGLLFFVEYTDPTIFRFNLTSGMITKFPLQRVEQIRRLAVDTHELQLYSFITYEGNTSLHLLKLDHYPLFTSIQPKTIHAFDVFNNTVLWVENTGDIYSVYSCKLTPTCLPNDLAVIYETSSKINDLKIYHPERQTRGEKSLCHQMACSHGCRALSPFTALCYCPAALTLASDKITCIEETETNISTKSTLAQPTYSTSTRSTWPNPIYSASTRSPLKQLIYSISTRTPWPNPTYSSSTRSPWQQPIYSTSTKSQRSQPAYSTSTRSPLSHPTYITSLVDDSKDYQKITTNQQDGKKLPVDQAVSPTIVHSPEEKLEEPSQKHLKLIDIVHTLMLFIIMAMLLTIIVILVRWFKNVSHDITPPQLDHELRPRSYNVYEVLDDYKSSE